MRQSNNRKSRAVTAFLYERLSRDDNLEGESYSIGNQKKLLTKVAKEKGYTNLVHFLDDGISGVTMDRPGFNDMMEQLAAGKAAAVFVKDLSRLGRNYIEVGRLTEEFFPEHDIRLVAVSDNIDTAEGENELAPIRNLFNEWYARDISKKRRIACPHRPPWAFWRLCHHLARRLPWRWPHAGRCGPGGCCRSSCAFRPAGHQFATFCPSIGLCLFVFP